MAIAETNSDSEERVELSEVDMEKRVGDITFRLRRASRILGMRIGEFKNYGPLTVRRTKQEFRVADVDGAPMESIPAADFDANDLAALLDHKIEISLNNL